MGMGPKFARIGLQIPFGAEVIPSMRHTEFGREPLSSNNPLKKGAGTGTAAIVSEFGGRRIDFFEKRVRTGVWGFFPRIIFCRLVSMEMLEVDIKSMPTIQSTCKQSTNITGCLMVLLDKEISLNNFLWFSARPRLRRKAGHA